MSRRRSVRVRIALACAGLFLVTGGVLVAVTYLLLDHGLANSIVPTTKAAADPQFLARCKTASDSSTIIKCKTAFSAGAAIGAKQQGQNALDQFLVYSLSSLGGLTVVAGSVGWALAGRVLRPLQAITAAARRASEHNLTDRIALQGPKDELKELADTFDGMLDRLDAAFASQKRFVANASHELRTPLTVMRTAIDVTLAKPNRDPDQLEAMATEVRQAVDGAEKLIDALLTLARSDRGPTGTEFVDLATAAEDAIDATSAQLAACDITMSSTLQPAELHGDRVLLERMVANLVQNAARHNVPHGWIRLDTGHRDGHAWLVIANGGPPLPTDMVPTLFEPFHRRHDRVGSDHGVGLGLSIVRSVATTHGGSVFGRALPDGGLEITATLPVTSGRATQTYWSDTPTTAER
jgi:signal transduction histidine kinase